MSCSNKFQHIIVHSQNFCDIDDYVELPQDSEEIHYLLNTYSESLIAEYQFCHWGSTVEYLFCSSSTEFYYQTNCATAKWHKAESQDGHFYTVIIDTVVGPASACPTCDHTESKSGHNSYATIAKFW